MKVGFHRGVLHGECESKLSVVGRLRESVLIELANSAKLGKKEGWT